MAACLWSSFCWSFVPFFLLSSISWSFLRSRARLTIFSSTTNLNSIADRMSKSSARSLAAWIRPRFSARMRKRARPAKRWLKRPGRLGFQTTRMIRWTFWPSWASKSMPFSDLPTATAISPPASTRACGRATPEPMAVETRFSRSMMRVSRSFLLSMSFCLARTSRSSSMASTRSLLLRSKTTCDRAR